jgi:hypothetical protein
MDWAKLGGRWRILVAAFTVVVIVGCNGGGGSDSGGQPLSGGTGTALLSWAPPVANNDGSPVDLMGFVIYAGSSP